MELIHRSVLNLPESFFKIERSSIKEEKKMILNFTKILNYSKKYV